MTFSHLHVASGYSLQYGTATPQALAERAAELGQPIMGLTDRDGLYGAVRWALACRSAGIARSSASTSRWRRPRRCTGTARRP